ncbi:MAG: potassium channel protein [Pseudomonadota bacterium]
MIPRENKLLIPALLGLVFFGAGTLGYTLIEGWNLLDSFYMTVITLATIGYGEIRPLSPGGRIFTIFLIFFGVGNVAYLVGQLTRAMVEGSLQRVLGRRKLEQQIKNLNNHFILCGYGRIGRMVGQEIQARQKRLVVVENNPQVIEQIERDGLLFIKGDASDEDNLISAGVNQAAGLISAVSSDADNLYIILTARGLNPDLFILSRANEQRSIKKLKGAGADQVVSPTLIGARKMAQAILRPAVADFLETTVHGGMGMDLAMEEILVTPQSRIKNVTLQESNIRRDLDLIIIAIKTSDGRMLFNPSAQAMIREGDTLIGVGRQDNMDRLCELLGANSDHAPRYFRNSKNPFPSA